MDTFPADLLAGLHAPIAIPGDEPGTVLMPHGIEPCTHKGPNGEGAREPPDLRERLTLLSRH